jgi:hypothetical protein
MFPSLNFAPSHQNNNSISESEKSWRLIVLPGIERVVAFQESDDGTRLMSASSISPSSYDVSDAKEKNNNLDNVIRLQEGDDVRVACAMIVRKQGWNGDLAILETIQ